MIDNEVIIGAESQDKENNLFNHVSEFCFNFWCIYINLFE